MYMTIRKGFAIASINMKRYHNQNVLSGIITKQINTATIGHPPLTRDNANDNKKLKLNGSVNHRPYTTAGVKIHQVTTKKKMTKLTDQERTEQLQPLLNAGWSMVNDRDAIYKEYVFGDFNQAFSFMSGCALLAEKINHHPEWFNVYNKVQVTMSTHDVSGLSSKDIRMAKYMEEHSKRYL